MRANRDSIFIATLILALLVSTAAVFVAGQTAGPRTIKVNGGGGFTDSASATETAGGTPDANSNGGGSGGGGGGGSGGGQTVVVTGDTIKIGAIYSESNGIDSTVEEDTVRACFQMANAHGGINGHKLTLVSYDDGLNADTAYSEAVRLVNQDHVFAIVGWLAPFGEARAAPYFEQNGVPIVGGLGVPEEFNNRFSFPVSPNFTKAGYLLGDYATGGGFPLKLRHPGVFLTQTAGINNVANGIQQGAGHNGVNVSSNDVVFVPFAATNFDQYLLQFQSEGVDGLITQLDPFSYVRLYQSMQRTNKIFKHLAGAGIDKQNVDQSIGSALNNTYSFMPIQEAQGNPTGNGEIDTYNRTVATYYRNQVPNMDAFSEGAWVACRVFTAALSRMGPNVTRDGLVNTLLTGSYSTSGMAPTLNYGNTGSVHDASRCATYIVYNGGRWTPTYNGFYCP